MITDNLKYKMLKAVKDSIYCFSFTVNEVEVERKPHSIELDGENIKVNLLLDNRDTGKIENIKLLEIDKSILFESNAIYYKNDGLGVYISFSINGISEVTY